MIDAPNYTIPSSVMLQVVDDETLLFNSETDLFFTLNEVGAVMWEILSENNSIQAVYEELQEIYDVPKEQLKTDLLKFAKSLAEQGLLE